jgi:light-regulated signal transduction histidine kinase (bacteriophytochrome)
MTPAAAESSSRDSPNVPWSDVVRFIRQLSHDLRNHLNAVELQSAYLGELATDPEIKEEIKRLRRMMSELGTILQKLSAGLGQPKPEVMPYGAADFIEDIRSKLTTDFPKESATVEWDAELPEGNLEIDPQLLQEAFLELFANAFRHQPVGQSLQASARRDGHSFVFRLREQKEGFDLSTENWGREPLRKISQGHYGLGLNRARAIVESHRGQLAAQYDLTSATLATTITLPVSGGGV